MLVQGVQIYTFFPRNTFYYSYFLILQALIFIFRGMRKVFRIISSLVPVLLMAGTALHAQTSVQTPAEKMKAKVDSIRNASMNQPPREEKKDTAVLKSIDPKMDAAIDSILAIPVDSSIFKGEHVSMNAIEIEDLCRQGRLYAEEYDFNEAYSSFEKALSLCTDSLRQLEIRELMFTQENAVSLQQYCTKPAVVAKQKFSLKDFFLYYPLQDRSWRPAPNKLDPDGGKFSRAVYVPERAKDIVYSAKDTLGVRNLMRTAWADTAWTVPAPAIPGLVSSEDEIYPMVCGDKLFFASEGLYGIGGYDIYVSNWDEESQTWGMPENMGFPFNSPHDDFLFINSSDGKYSLFASNRDCSKDSVFLYVLEYEPLAVRTPVDSPSELSRLCSLRPSYDLKKVDNRNVMSLGNGDEQTREYMDKVADLRALKDTLAMHHKELEGLRRQYADATEWQRVNLASEIMAKESELPAIQKKIDLAGKELQKIEMEFLMNGVVIDAKKAASESNKTIVGADKSYTFTRKNPGDPL